MMSTACHPRFPGAVRALTALACAAALVACGGGGSDGSTTPVATTPQVTLSVSNGGTVSGDVVITLEPDKAPITVANFLAYVNSGFYTGTTFHRVVKGFVVQGGGYLADGTARATSAPIALEVGKGLSNVKWSVAMARTADANSATSQFFINTVDNLSLDTVSGGYAVFGTVTANSALVAAMENVPCTLVQTSFCVPNTPLVITAARQTR